EDGRQVARATASKIVRREQPSGSPRGICKIFPCRGGPHLSDGSGDALSIAEFASRTRLILWGPFRTTLRSHAAGWVRQIRRRKVTGNAFGHGAGGETVGDGAQGS